MNTNLAGTHAPRRKIVVSAVIVVVLLVAAFLVGRGVSGESASAPSPTTTSASAADDTAGPTTTLPNATTTEPSTTSTVVVEPPAPPTTARATGGTPKPKPPTPSTTVAPPPPPPPAAPDPTIRLAQILINESGVGSVQVDGLSTQALINLIIAIQNANGLPATGSLDAGTLQALKIAALVRTLVGTWKGTVVSGGTTLGTFIDVIHPNGSTTLTFDFLPCVGAGQFYDFDGLRYTTVAIVPLDAACTPVSPVRTIVTIVDANTLTYNYGNGLTTGTLTRIG